MQCDSQREEMWRITWCSLICLRSTLFAERPPWRTLAGDATFWSSLYCWWFKGYLQLQDTPPLLMIDQSDLVQLYRIQFELVRIIPPQATFSLILWQYINGLWFLTFCISPSRARPETNPSGVHNFMGKLTLVFLVAIDDYLRKDAWI